MSKYTTPVLRRGEIELLVDTRDDPQAISSLCVLHNTESGTRSEPMPIQQAVKWGYWEPVKINLIEPTYLLSEHSGAMIALHIPEEVGKKLALPDGISAKEMHVTLVYMGEADELDRNRVGDIVDNFARTHPSFSGRVGGLGRFLASKSSNDQDVVYASVDAPDLPEFRQSLVHAIEGIVKLGSSKSGFYGHKGRPGKRGGSVARGIAGFETAGDAIQYNIEHAGDLNEAQRNAVRLYTGALFRSVNAKLRYSTEPEFEELKPKVAATIKGLDESMLPLAEPIALYRTVGKDFAKQLQRRAIDDSFIDHGFVSSTLVDPQVKSVISSAGNSWMRIQALSGTKAAFLEKYSNSDGEAEVLLARGSRFRITSMGTGSTNDPFVVEVLSE